VVRACPVPSAIRRHRPIHRTGDGMSLASGSRTKSLRQFVRLSTHRPSLRLSQCPTWMLLPCSSSASTKPGPPGAWTSNWLSFACWAIGLSIIEAVCGASQPACGRMRCPLLFASDPRERALRSLARLSERRYRDCRPCGYEGNPSNQVVGK
jgi:hypothetical protein